MEKTTNLSDLFNKKQAGHKLSMLTAYNYPFARIMDNTDLDMILIGDSLGMTQLGYDSTIPVTMDNMCTAVESVARATTKKFLVADMPFMSYQVSLEKAVENAGRLMQAGANAVKLEGACYIDEIKAIVKAGIPVMGHLGFTPQSVNALGGPKVQGKTEQLAEKIIKEAQLIEQAGVFSIVLEMVPREVAKKITDNSSSIIIGIGAGPDTDGQVLVVDDILGIFDKFKPKFVKRYAELGTQIKDAISDYCSDVSSGQFPSKENYYK